MSYQTYPPYGQPPPTSQHGSYYPPGPPAHSPYPPASDPYGRPPPGHYPPPAGYHQQPPAPQGLYQQPGQAQGYYTQPPPPQGNYQQYQQPSQGQYWQQPPPFQQQPGAYAGPQHYSAPPAYPSPGYGPAQQMYPGADADAAALRKAMKGLGTDELALTRILAYRAPDQVNAIREAYSLTVRRDLIKDIKKETSGWFEETLLALARGPLLHDIYLLHDALHGLGTKEEVLNEVLLGRSNADLNAIKAAYRQEFASSLESAVEKDLSMKTKRHFSMVLQAGRTEDGAPVIQAEVEEAVQKLYDATEGRIGTDEILVCSMFSKKSDAQLRAIAHAYQLTYARSVEQVIKKEFSGHMEDALLFQIRHAVDPYAHQAQLLEDAMAGLGTRDRLLLSRVVRSHWDPVNMRRVRSTYEQRYSKDLAARIKSDVHLKADYRRALLACIGEQV